MNYLILLSIISSLWGNLETDIPKKLSFAESSTITIQGTSTLHDWESVSKDLNGFVTLNQDKKSADAIEALEISVPVQSIKSGKSKMDEITYDAFNYKEHPNITFKLDHISNAKDGSATAHGTLSMAGTSKQVQVTGKAKVENNQLVIDGEYPIDMTQYGMETPTAMLGTIKVGKDVTILFHLVVKA